MVLRSKTVKTAIRVAFTLFLAITCYRLFGVAAAESSNRSVALAVELDSVLRTGTSPGEKDLLHALDTAREAGVTTVVIRIVETIDSLASIGRLGVFTRSSTGVFPRDELRSIPANATTAVVLNPGTDPTDVIDALKQRYGSAQVSSMNVEWDAQRTTVVFGSWGADVGRTPVRYDPASMSTARASGLGLVLSLPRHAAIGYDHLHALMSDAQASGGIEGFLLEGEAPGDLYSKDAQRFISMLETSGIPIIGVEPLDSNQDDQVNLRRLASMLGWNMVRAHILPISDASLERTPVRALRAVRERNIRFLLFRPSGDVEGLTTVTAVSDTLSMLSEGYRAGPATRFTAPDDSVWYRLAAMLAMSLLPLVAKPGARWALPLSAGILLAGGVSVGLQWQIVSDAWLTGVAIMSATLAVVMIRPSSTPGRVLADYTAALAVTLAGGLLLHSLGIDAASIIGFYRFRGVKVLLITPGIIVAAQTLWCRRGSVRRIDLASKVPRITVLAGLIAIGAYVYLVRSGNGGYTPAIEQWARDTLDAILPIRPRFKEFLLGFPALSIVAWAKTRDGLPWSLVAVAATVGTAGAIDSFAHYHTPVALAVLRTLISGGVGMVFGLIAVFALHRLTTRQESLG